MILTKTPFRMSFFGGGTDCEDFFEKNKGSVISTTFDKYSYVTVRHLPKFFDYSTEIVYSKTERVNKLDKIDHPMVKNAMKMLDMHELRITYDADLPARTGLGTSSTFAVGLLNAFYSLKGKFVSKEQLAKDAIYLERVLCDEHGGWQDQIAASYGGLNRIDFDNSGFRVTPIIISKERKEQLDNNLLLFFTGFTRNSSEVYKHMNVSKNNKEKYLKQLLIQVDDAQDILQNKNRNIDDFGRLLDKEWKIKRSMSKNISNSRIDKLYEIGKKAGALGGKLLGAGGGGFLLFYVPSKKQTSVRKALKSLMEVPFNFEEGGTKVIFYTPEIFDINTTKEK